MKKTVVPTSWYSQPWFARSFGLHAMGKMTIQGAQQSFNRASSHGHALRMRRKHNTRSHLHRGALCFRITAEEQARSKLSIALRAVGA